MEKIETNDASTADQNQTGPQLDRRSSTNNRSSQSRRYAGGDLISVRHDVLTIGIAIVLIGAAYLGYREYQWYSLKQHIAGMVGQMSRGLSGNDSDSTKFCRMHPQSWLCNFVDWR